MSIRALHISHTDIRTDSRILKEMEALSAIEDTEVIGIGAEDQDGAPAASKQHAIQILVVRPLPRWLRALNRPIYLALRFFDLSYRLVWLGVRFRPRVVHCHDTLVLPAGVLIKWFTGARVIYDAHELESEKNGQTSALSVITLLIEKTCWRWIDGFITVSESIREWYFERFPRKASAVVLNSPVFNPLNDSSQVKVSAHFRQTFDIPSESLIFVYVGILAKGRGIETLLDVFSESGMAAHLVFMGYGDLDSSIAAIASRHTNIHLHAPVPHELVVEYVSGADVGLCFVENVSLSDYYCLPNKLFEYAFGGTAVLASDFPEIRQIVEQYSLGRVCRPDREAIREAVLSFIATSPVRCVPKDLYPLTWERQAQCLVSLYKALLLQPTTST
jgi:glycosyltransferase involved in cell wall biosynthesis